MPEPAPQPGFLMRFNAARFAAAEQMLRPCLDIPRWYNEIAAARPFASAGELLSFAELAAPDFTDAEIEAAHPGRPGAGGGAGEPTAGAGLTGSELRQRAILQLEELLGA